MNSDLLYLIYMLGKRCVTEHIRSQRESMHAFIRRERVERLEAEGGVPKCGRGQGQGKGKSTLC